MAKLEELKLSPVENIMLGKAFKLPTWIDKGYISLVGTKSDLSSNFSLKELIDALGWETTCRILWVRDQTAASARQGNSSSSYKELTGLWVTEDKMSCGSCYLAGTEKEWRIKNLRHTCPECDQLPSYSGVIIDCSVARFEPSQSTVPSPTEYWVSLDKIFCATCYRHGNKTQLKSWYSKCSECDCGPSYSVVAWDFNTSGPGSNPVAGQDEDMDERAQMISEKVLEMVEAELERA